MRISALFLLLLLLYTWILSKMVGLEQMHLKFRGLFDGKSMYICGPKINDDHQFNFLFPLSACIEF